jgi:hypothetical protein
VCNLDPLSDDVILDFIHLVGPAVLPVQRVLIVVSIAVLRSHRPVSQSKNGQSWQTHRL